MSFPLNNKHIQTINKTSEILIKAFEEIFQLTSQFMKYSSEQQKRIKESRQPKPPKIFFQKEGPLPDNQKQKPQSLKNGTIKNVTQNDDKGANKTINNGGAPSTNMKKVYQQYLAKGEENKVQTNKTIKQQKKIEGDQNQTIKKSSKGSKIPQKKQKEEPVAKKIVNPERPKPPISAFLRFNKANLDSVKKEFPHISQTDVVSVTGHMWNQAPTQVKRKYEGQYLRDKEKYDAQMIEFYRRFPEEKTKKQIQKEKAERKK